MNTAITFEQIVKALTEAKIPCRVKHYAYEDGSVDFAVECGFDYPDRLVDEIYSAFKDNLPSEVSICASSDGGHVVATKTICGGPRRYF